MSGGRLGCQVDAWSKQLDHYLPLAGNHDLGVRGALPLEEFSRGAALAARWTQGVIVPETRECHGWLVASED